MEAVASNLKWFSEKFGLKIKTVNDIDFLLALSFDPEVVVKRLNTLLHVFFQPVSGFDKYPLYLLTALFLGPENTRVCAVVETRRKIENQLSTTPTIRLPTFFTFNY